MEELEVVMVVVFSAMVVVVAMIGIDWTSATETGVVTEVAAEEIIVAVPITVETPEETS